MHSEAGVVLGYFLNFDDALIKLFFINLSFIYFWISKNIEPPSEFNSIKDFLSLFYIFQQHFRTSQNIIIVENI